MKSFRLLFLFAALFLAFSCGKVVQEARVEKDELAFRLLYSVDVVSANVLAANEISVKEDVFATVSAYTEKGLRKELSWGRGLSEWGEDKETPMALVSKAYTKRGLVIQGKADKTWTFPKLNVKEGAYTWAIDSNDLRRGYPRYFVSVFTGPSRYRLALVDDARVSQNAKITLDTLSLYETFLSVLKLMRMQEGDIYLQDEELFLLLFDASFFKQLSYTLPTNTTPDFSSKKPIFRFERLFEKVLLDVWDLIQVDYVETIAFIESIENDLIPFSAREQLKKNIEHIQTLDGENSVY